MGTCLEFVVADIFFLEQNLFSTSSNKSSMSSAILMLYFSTLVSKFVDIELQNKFSCLSGAAGNSVVVAAGDTCALAFSL